MMGYFDHLRIIIKHPHWCHLVVGTILLVLVMVPYSMFLLVMVDVVLVLGTTTFTPRKFIFGSMMVILCHLIVVCIKYHCSLEASHHYPSCMI